MSVNSPIITKIYPDISELNSIKNNLQCTEEGCLKLFTSESNLCMHLVKHHKKQHLKKPIKENVVKQFHCPDTKCDYHDKMHFAKIKNLKQHYLKIHADKTFVCAKCNKGFATIGIQTKHSEACGVNFQCLDCDNTYASYEALMTHSRRVKHRILNKSVFIPQAKSKMQTEPGRKKHSFLLPKQSSSMQTLSVFPVIVQIKDNSTRIDKGIQVELSDFKSKPKTKRRSTAETQTCARKKPKKTAETQTSGDCILRRAIQEAKMDFLDFEQKETQTKKVYEEKKCIETQTKLISSWGDNNDLIQEQSINWNDPIVLVPENQSKCINWNELDQAQNQTNWANLTEEKQTNQTLDSSRTELNLSFLENENIMHSSSQTNLNSFNFLDQFGNCNNSQTQTDVIYHDRFLQSTVFQSHIETQTIDAHDLDLCSNMYTQTCNESLLSELEFTNIQTQTNWPDYDMFVSTETQTLLTHNTKSLLDMALNGREISHMETQTDMEFQQLLEEINA